MNKYQMEVIGMTEVVLEKVQEDDQLHMMELNEK